MTAPLSGWCLPPGQRHDSACRVCAMRQRDGLLAPCGCVGHQSDNEAAKALLETEAADGA